MRRCVSPTVVILLLSCARLAYPAVDGGTGAQPPVEPVNLNGDAQIYTELCPDPQRDERMDAEASVIATANQGDDTTPPPTTAHARADLATPSPSSSALIVAKVDAAQQTHADTGDAVDPAATRGADPSRSSDSELHGSGVVAVGSPGPDAGVASPPTAADSTTGEASESLSHRPSEVDTVAEPAGDEGGGVAHDGTEKIIAAPMRSDSVVRASGNEPSDDSESDTDEMSTYEAFRSEFDDGEEEDEDDHGTDTIEGHHHTKEHHINYASVKCGAQVMAANKDAKNPTHVLIDDDDKYLLNPCESDAFLVVKLCDDIQIHSITLSNREMFSSMVTSIDVKISNIYPVPDSGWTSLGSFKGDDTLEKQMFNITEPGGFATYMKIEFSDHIGTEHYCPISSLKIFGWTMIEEYNYKEVLKKRTATALSDAGTALPDTAAGSTTQPEAPVSTAMDSDDNDTAGVNDSNVLASLARLVGRVFSKEKNTSGEGIAGNSSNGTAVDGDAATSNATVASGASAGAEATGAEATIAGTDTPATNPTPTIADVLPSASRVVEALRDVLAPRQHESYITDTECSVGDLNTVFGRTELIVPTCASSEQVVSVAVDGEALPQVSDDRSAKVARSAEAAAAAAQVPPQSVKASANKRVDNGESDTSQPSPKSPAGRIRLPVTPPESTADSLANETAKTLEQSATVNATTNATRQTSEKKACDWWECINTTELCAGLGSSGCQNATAVLRGPARRWDRPFSPTTCAIFHKRAVGALQAHLNVSRSGGKLKPKRAPGSVDDKSSIYSKLSNKIKALEKNMTISGRFLEALSGRFKKINATSVSMLAEVQALRDAVNASTGSTAAVPRLQTVESATLTLIDMVDSISASIGELREACDRTAAGQPNGDLRSEFSPFLASLFGALVGALILPVSRGVERWVVRRTSTRGFESPIIG